MHYYQCPYCSPSPKSKLEELVEERTEGKIFPKKISVKSMKCKKCKNLFSITPEFLKEQKRKIKDG